MAWQTWLEAKGGSCHPPEGSVGKDLPEEGGDPKWRVCSRFHPYSWPGEWRIWLQFAHSPRTVSAGKVKGLYRMTGHTGQDLQLSGSERLFRPLFVHWVGGDLDHTPFNLSISFCKIGTAGVLSQDSLERHTRPFIELLVPAGQEVPWLCSCYSPIIIVGKTLDAWPLPWVSQGCCKIWESKEVKSGFR